MSPYGNMAAPEMAWPTPRDGAQRARSNQGLGASGLKGPEPKCKSIINPHDRLLTKIAETGVDLREVVWVKEFLLGRLQRVRVDGQLSEEVRVTSGVPQGSTLGPPLFLAYVNDIWRNTESNIWLFTDYCIIYRKITDSRDIDKLQTDLTGLGEWAVENKIKINQGKSKAVSFTKARVKEQIRYYFGEKLIPEASSFKYLGIILRNDLNWADHVNYTLRKAWKALHFMCILKNGNNNTKHLAYTALVAPVLEYRVVCWDRYREGQVSALNWVQKRVAKFAYDINELGWKTLAQ